VTKILKHKTTLSTILRDIFSRNRVGLNFTRYLINLIGASAGWLAVQTLLNGNRYLTKSDAKSLYEQGGKKDRSSMFEKSAEAKRFFSKVANNPGKSGKAAGYRKTENGEELRAVDAYKLARFHAESHKLWRELHNENRYDEASALTEDEIKQRGGAELLK